MARRLAIAFYAGDIRVEGPHPFCSSGGNLGNGRTRTAMYTDCIEQLRGTAGARQVKVRAETALGAFTTPSSGGGSCSGSLRAEGLCLGVGTCLYPRRQRLPSHRMTVSEGEHPQRRKDLEKFTAPGLPRE